MRARPRLMRLLRHPRVILIAVPVIGNPPLSSASGIVHPLSGLFAMVLSNGLHERLKIECLDWLFFLMVLAEVGEAEFYLGDERDDETIGSVSGAHGDH